MEIKTRTEIGKISWDNVVEQSSQGWMWHLYDCQDFISRAWNLKELGFGVVDKEGNVMGILPLHIRKWSRVIKTLQSNGMGACGPALLDNLGRHQKKKILEMMREHIDYLAKRHSIDECVILLPPSAPAYLGENCPKVNPLLEMGFQNMLSQTYVINLEKDLDTIWGNTHTLARRKIRRAEKEGFEIRKATSLDDIRAYYEIHKETYTRTGTLPHPFAYFEGIWNAFGEKGIANFFMAYKGKELVASLNVGAFKTSCCYWTGCSKSAYLESGVNYLLQWHAIKWAKEQGYKWYESGEAFPHIRYGKLRGLNDFKRSFGGDMYPYYQGRIDYKPVKIALVNLYREIKRQVRNEKSK